MFVHITSTIVFEDFGKVSRRFFAQSLTLKKQIFFLNSVLNVTSSIVVVEGVRRYSTVHLAHEGNILIKAQSFFCCHLIESTTPRPILPSACEGRLCMLEFLTIYGG